MYFPHSSFYQNECDAPFLHDFSRSTAGMPRWVTGPAQPQAAHCLIILLLSLFSSSLCPMPHHPPAVPVPQQPLLVPQVHWQCLPSPSAPVSFLPLHPHLLPKGVMEHSRVVYNSSLLQGYSSSRRRVVYPLHITYTGLCFAIYIFRGFYSCDGSTILT